MSHGRSSETKGGPIALVRNAMWKAGGGEGTGAPGTQGRRAIMKTHLCVGVALLVAFVVPTGAGAASGTWLTQGSGLVAGTTQRWEWVAHSDVGGSNVRGHFAASDSATGAEFRADVTCLSVMGSSARIGILITDSTEPTRPSGQSTFITMSSFGTGEDTVNRVGADVNFSTPLTVCPAPSGALAPFDGPINVRDGATPGSWLSQGSGLVAGTTQRWQWVAVSNVGGSNVNGHFSASDSATGTGFEATVTCLNVLSNTARVGILITDSTEPTRPAGQSTFITMSSTGTGTNAVNRVGADVNVPTPLTVCPAPSGAIVLFDGPINIHD